MVMNRRNCIDMECSQEGNVSGVLYERRENVPLAQAVLEKCVAHVSGPGEDYNASQPNFEAVHVETIDA